MEDRWLSVEEIATYLGIKRDTVYRWINRKTDASPQDGTIVEVSNETRLMNGSERRGAARRKVEVTQVAD